MKEEIKKWPEFTMEYDDKGYLQLETSVLTKDGRDWIVRDTFSFPMRSDFSEFNKIKAAMAIFIENVYKAQQQDDQIYYCNP